MLPQHPVVSSVVVVQEIGCRIDLFDPVVVYCANGLDGGLRWHLACNAIIFNRGGLRIDLLTVNVDYCSVVGAFLCHDQRQNQVIFVLRFWVNLRQQLLRIEAGRSNKLSITQKNCLSNYGLQTYFSLVFFLVLDKKRRRRY